MGELFWSERDLILDGSDQLWTTYSLFLVHLIANITIRCVTQMQQPCNCNIVACNLRRGPKFKKKKRFSISSSVSLGKVTPKRWLTTLYPLIHLHVINQYRCVYWNGLGMSGQPAVPAKLSLIASTFASPFRRKTKTAMTWAMHLAEALLDAEALVFSCLRITCFPLFLGWCSDRTRKSSSDLYSRRDAISLRRSMSGLLALFAQIMPPRFSSAVSLANIHTYTKPNFLQALLSRGAIVSDQLLPDENRNQNKVEQVDSHLFFERVRWCMKVLFSIRHVLSLYQLRIIC